MPAKKAGRQAIKRTQRNRSTRTATRTTISKALQTVVVGEPDEAESAVREAMSVMDRSVQKGILHKNNVARRKSRMAVRLNKLIQADAS